MILVFLTFISFFGLLFFYAEKFNRESGRDHHATLEEKSCPVIQTKIHLFYTDAHFLNPKSEIPVLLHFMG